jgi:hypothetical protein
MLSRADVGRPVWLVFVKGEFIDQIEPMLDAVEPTAHHPQPCVHPGESHLYPVKSRSRGLSGMFSVGQSRRFCSGYYGSGLPPFGQCDGSKFAQDQIARSPRAHGRLSAARVGQRLRDRCSTVAAHSMIT